MLPGFAPPRPRTLDDLLGPALSRRLEALDVFSRKVLSGKLPGERQSKRRGRSVEFDDFRPYVEGDDLRHIDWNIVGRLDKLFIKLFREEEDLSLNLLLDASASMDTGVPHKLHMAARLAAAIGYIGLVNQNRVSLTMFGLPASSEHPRGMASLVPSRGRTSVRRLADVLLGGLAAREAWRGKASEETLSTNDALRVWARGRAQRGITLLLSDMLPGSVAQRAKHADSAEATSLAHLTSPDGAFDATVLQVLSPGEMDPSVEQQRGLLGDVQLTDIESGRAIDVTITDATVNAFRLRMREHVAGVRAQCRGLGVAHFVVQSDASVEELVTSTLRKGGILR
jgi:uncharacterized protein (DUF58 family)